MRGQVSRGVLSDVRSVPKDVAVNQLQRGCQHNVGGRPISCAVAVYLAARARDIRGPARAAAKKRKPCTVRRSSSSGGSVMHVRVCQRDGGSTGPVADGHGARVARELAVGDRDHGRGPCDLKPEPFTEAPGPIGVDDFDAL